MMRECMINGTSISPLNTEIENILRLFTYLLYMLPAIAVDGETCCAKDAVIQHN